MLRGALIGVALLLAALLTASVILPKLTGSSSYTITGRSMEPSIGQGSLIVARSAPPESVRIGDVVTFQLESGAAAVATHRVVGFTFLPNGERAFVTAGDNNAGEIDAQPVRSAQLRGVLWYSIPLIGRVNALVTGEARSWLLPLAVSGLLGYGAWMVMSGIIDRRRKTERRSPTTT